MKIFKILDLLKHVQKNGNGVSILIVVVALSSSVLGGYMYIDERYAKAKEQVRVEDESKVRDKTIDRGSKERDQKLRKQFNKGKNQILDKLALMELRTTFQKALENMYFYRNFFTLQSYSLIALRPYSLILDSRT